MKLVFGGWVRTPPWWGVCISAELGGQLAALKGSVIQGGHHGMAPW